MPDQSPAARALAVVERLKRLELECIDEPWEFCHPDSDPSREVLMATDDEGGMSPVLQFHHAFGHSQVNLHWDLVRDLRNSARPLLELVEASVLLHGITEPDQESFSFEYQRWHDAREKYRAALEKLAALEAL